MAPVPKRKHSTARKGRRRAAVQAKVARRLEYTRTYVRK